MKRIMPVLTFGLIVLQAHASDKLEIRGASQEDLKRMAQFEKDHADRALSDAAKAREAAELKKQKQVRKDEK